MIKIDKDFAARPTGIDYLAKNARVVVFIRQAIRDGVQHEAKGNYYRGQIKACLFAKYHYKCAYCEIKLYACESALHVDHYRPRKQYLPGKKQNFDPLTHHNGYPWLTYEWSNLLPVCATCNGGKTSGFPIRGTRVTAAPFDDTFTDVKKLDEFRANQPSYLAEDPLLINPELDEPGTHFSFDIKGEIKAGSDRAKATISTYKLDRPGLIESRRKIINQFHARLKKMAALLYIQQQKGHFKERQHFCDGLQLAFKPIFEEIDQLGQIHQEYSAFKNFIKQHFKETNFHHIPGHQLIKRARDLHRKQWCP